jgi:hypothetical protein
MVDTRQGALMEADLRHLRLKTPNEPNYCATFQVEQTLPGIELKSDEVNEERFSDI